jgi:hypothetical protein
MKIDLHTIQGLTGSERRGDKMARSLVPAIFETADIQREFRMDTTLAFPGRPISTMTASSATKSSTRFAKLQTNERWGQSPQLYRGESLSLNDPIFEKEVKVSEKKPKPVSQRMRVKIQGKGRESLAAKVSSIPGTEIVEGEYDLLLAAEGPSFSLYLLGGERFCTVERMAEAISRVGNYARVREFMN